MGLFFKDINDECIMHRMEVIESQDKDSYSECMYCGKSYSHKDSKNKDWIVNGLLLGIIIFLLIILW